MIKKIIIMIIKKNFNIYKIILKTKHDNIILYKKIKMNLISLFVKK